MASLLRLNDNVYYEILSNLRSVDLVKLSMSCRSFNNIVKRHLSFVGAHWDQFDVKRAPGFPPPSRLQPTVHSKADDDFNNEVEEQLPEIFPPAFGHHAATQIRNYLYLPYLSVNPSVYVLNLTTRLWERHFLKIANSKYSPNQSFQWQPLMAPITSYNDELYLFGGTHHPMLSSDHPTHATSSIDERSTGILSDSLYKINIENWTIIELGNSKHPEAYLNSFSKRPRNRNSHSSESYEESTWPAARRGHSMACIRDSIVVFGGICENSIGDNDVFVYDIKQDRWKQPEIKGIAPDVRFGHSQTVVGDEIFYFGGAQVDDPVNVIFDDLHKLTYNVIEDCFYWSNYRSPEVYSQARFQKLKAKRHIQQSRDEGMQIDTSSQRTRRYTGTSSEDSTEEFITTTGQPPRERLEATMILVGSHKLAIFAGVTIVPASHDYETYDEYCAYNTAAIDVFDFRYNHWTRIGVTGSGSAINTFIVESCCAYIAPPGMDAEHYVQQSSEKEAWQYIVVGHRLHWIDFQVNKCSSGSDTEGSDLLVDRVDDALLKFKGESKKGVNKQPKSSPNTNANSNASNSEFVLDINKIISESSSSNDEGGDGSKYNAIYGPTAGHVKAAAVGTVQKSPTSFKKTGSMMIKKKGDVKGSWMTFYSRDNQLILASTTARTRNQGGDESQSPEDSPMTTSSESLNVVNEEPDEINNSFGPSYLRDTGGHAKKGKESFYLSTVGFVKSLSFNR